MPFFQESDPWGPQPNELGSGLAYVDAADSALTGDVVGGAAGLFGSFPQGALINAGSQVLGKMLSPSSAGPSRADSGLYKTETIDNSGWTVSTGSSSAQGGARGLDLPPWMMLAGLALVVVAWVRSKKA